MDKLYDEHKNMIFSIANQFYEATKIDLDELECEGNYCFVKCATKFDKKRNVMFSTYLHNALNFSLYSYCRRRNRQLSELGLNYDQENTIFEGEREEYRTGCKASFDKDKTEIMVGKKISYYNSPRDCYTDIISEISFNSLSKDSLKIIEAIFNAPEEILSTKKIKSDNLKIKNKITKKSIYDYFRENNWKRKRIFEAFREIELFLCL